MFIFLTKMRFVCSGVVEYVYFAVTVTCSCDVTVVQSIVASAIIVLDCENFFLFSCGMISLERNSILVDKVYMSLHHLTW